ncbi:MAG: hypothetical protein ACK50F_07625, partial [Betaproteobacteria bacterium]
MRLPAPTRPDAAAPRRRPSLLTPSAWLLGAALLQGCQTPPAASTAAPAAAPPAASAAPSGQKAVPAAPSRATAAAATGT